MTVTNVTPPVISGTAKQGFTVSVSNGTWTKDLDYLTYVYQWERCDAAGANCVNIGAATNISYVVQAADVGHTLRARVTATEHANPPAGTDYYVTTTGSDSTGDGSIGNPWKTVKKACDTVASGTIHVGAGTFVETGTLVLASGVNLVGASQATTIIRASTTFTPLLSITSTTGPQSVSAMTFDGQTKTKSAYGIYVQNASLLTIDDIKSYGFVGPNNCSGGALDVRSASDLVVSNSTFMDSGGGFGGYCSGTLGLGSITRGTIHDNIVSANAGYAVKASAVNDTTVVNMTDVEIYNNDFSVGTQTCSSWNTLCVEIFDTTFVRCRIHHNNLNTVLSTTGPNQNPPLASGVRLEIDHNYWDVTWTGSGYAWEASVNSSEFHHNYILGGLYPVAQTEGYNMQKLNIHHNVIDQTKGPVLAVLITGGCQNCIFDHNTVINNYGVGTVRSDHLRDGFFNVTTGSTLSITNNILNSTVSIGDKLGLGLSQCTININDFYNLTTNNYSNDTNSIFTNPLIPLTGSFPAKYTPAANTTYGAFADGTWSDVGPQ